MSVLEQVQKVISEEFELPLADVTASAKLYEDLDFDSLDAIDLIVALEQTFEVNVSEEVAKGLLSVEEVAGYVEKLLTLRAAVA
jgi:acyl carrier protein